MPSTPAWLSSLEESFRNSSECSKQKDKNSDFKSHSTSLTPIPEERLYKLTRDRLYEALQEYEKSHNLPPIHQPLSTQKPLRRNSYLESYGGVEIETMLSTVVDTAYVTAPASLLSPGGTETGTSPHVSQASAKNDGLNDALNASKKASKKNQVSPAENPIGREHRSMPRSHRISEALSFSKM
jgi:hypothetical protein